MAKERNMDGATPCPLPKAHLGFGIGLRRPHFDEILDNHQGVDFLEIISENYMRFGGKSRDIITRARDVFDTIIPHGVGLSIGGIDPLNMDYLTSLRDLVQLLDPPWFSDHLSYSSAFGREYYDLMPLQFSEEAIVHIVERIEQVRDIVGKPLVLENPSYYASMPGSEMTEAEFTREIMVRSGCGMLLDVNNVYVNAQNHGYDAKAFIDAMPADQVVQYHIAGHDGSGEFLVDTHGSHIIPPVYELYKYALKTVGPALTLLEWDNNIPPLEILLEENEHVRAAAADALD